MNKISNLENSNRRKFLASCAISIFGDGITAAVMVLSANIAGYSVLETGWILAASAVPKCIVLLWGGVAGDRYERRRLLALAYILAGSAQTVSGFLLLAHGPFIILLMAQIVFGSAVAIARPASMAYLPAVTDADGIAHANTFLTAASSVASIAGPLLGVAFVALSATSWAIIVDGLSFFVATLLLFGLPSSIGNARQSLGAWATIKSSSRDLLAVRWLLPEMSASAIQLFMVTGPLLVLGPSMVSNVGSPNSWPIALAVFGIGQITGALAGGRSLDTSPVLKWAAYGMALLALPPLFLILHLPIYWFVLAELFAGIAIGYYQVTVTTAMQRSVPEGSLARVFSLNAFISLSLLPAAFVLAPIIASIASIELVFILSVGGSLAAVIILLSSISVRTYSWKKSIINNDSIENMKGYDEVRGS